MDHRIDQLSVAQSISLACVGKQVGRVGHGLHAARDHDGSIAGLDRLRCKGYCFQSRAANFVDCHGTYFGRQSAEESSLARGILPEARGDDIAHDALVHQFGINVGALDSFADGASGNRAIFANLVTIQEIAKFSKSLNGSGYGAGVEAARGENPLAQAHRPAGAG